MGGKQVEVSKKQRKQKRIYKKSKRGIGTEKGELMRYHQMTVAMTGRKGLKTVQVGSRRTEEEKEKRKTMFENSNQTIYHDRKKKGKADLITLVAQNSRLFV